MQGAFQLRSAPEGSSRRAGFLPRGSWGLALAVMLLVPLLYLPSLRGGFVYDSVGQVVYSNYIHDAANRADVLTLRVLARDELDRNRPLILASLMADAALWGREPFGYRLTNVLLHALNTALLLLVIAAALRARGAGARTALPAAAFGALVFALHPLVVEVVAEPSNREDSLVLLAFLAGLFVVLKCAAGTPRSPRLANVALASLALLAVAAKESGAAAPFIFAAGVWIFDRRRWRQWLPGLVLGLVLVLAFLTVSYVLRPVDSAVFATQPPSLASDMTTALGVQSRIWTRQLAQIFWPAGLSAHYTPAVLEGISLPVAVVCLVLALGAGAAAAWRNRLAGLGLAVFVLGVLPVSNIAPQFHPVADRFLYVPMAGVGMMMAGLMAALPAAAKPVAVRSAAWVLAVALLGGLLIVNWQRQKVWQNAGALWADVIEKFPGQPIAYLGLANESYRQGDFESAREFAAKGVAASRARWDDLLALRAVTEWETGRKEEARSTFRLLKAVSTDYRDLNHRRLELRSSPEQLATLREIEANEPASP